MKEGSVDANSGKEGRRDPRNASYLHILDQDNFSQFYKKKKYRTVGNPKFDIVLQCQSLCQCN